MRQRLLLVYSLWRGADLAEASLAGLPRGLKWYTRSGRASQFQICETNHPKRATVGLRAYQSRPHPER